MPHTTVKTRFWNTTWSSAKVFQNRVLLQNRVYLCSENSGPSPENVFQNSVLFQDPSIHLVFTVQHY